MRIKRVSAVAGVLATAWLVSLAAGQGTRVACLDVVRAFNEYQKQKDLTEEMRQQREKLQAEELARRQKIDALQTQVDALSEDDPTLSRRVSELLQLQIDYKNWADLKQAGLQREISVWSIRIYREILKATEEVANQQGYDLVFYKDEFVISPNADPESIKAQIQARKLVFARNSVEITQAVLDKLNNDYRTRPKEAMLQVP
jgi:Skp family chaperone for outer membrane proteins